MKIFAALTALILLATPAAAFECKTEYGLLSTKVEAAKAYPSLVSEKISDVIVARLLKEKGVPPGVANGPTPTEPFDIYYFHSGRLGALFITQGDCIMDEVGPGSPAAIEGFLGIISADSPQGERVD